MYKKTSLVANAGFINMEATRHNDHDNIALMSGCSTMASGYSTTMASGYSMTASECSTTAFGLLGHEGQANTRRLLHEINSVWVHTKNRAAQTLTTAPLGGTLQVASELFGLRYLSLGGTRTASAKALVTRWHPDSARRDTRLSTSSHEIHQLFTLVHLPDLKQDNLTFVLKFNPSNF